MTEDLEKEGALGTDEESPRHAKLTMNGFNMVAMGTDRYSLLATRSQTERILESTAFTAGDLHSTGVLCQSGIFNFHC